MKNTIGRAAPTKRIDNIQGWLSILPVLLIILIIRGYPIIFGIVKSFTNWDGLFRLRCQSDLKLAVLVDRGCNPVYLGIWVRTLIEHGDQAVGRVR